MNAYTYATPRNRPSDDASLGPIACRQATRGEIRECALTGPLAVRHAAALGDLPSRVRVPKDGATYAIKVAGRWHGPFPARTRAGEWVTCSDGAMRWSWVRLRRPLSAAAA